MTLREALDRYILDAREPFGFEECLNAVSQTLGKVATPSSRSRLKKALGEDWHAIMLDDGRWVSRFALFRGARFRIKPTDYELERGILFIGHRMIPFRDHRLDPKEYVVSDGAGQALPWKTVEASVEEAFFYHCLLPADEMAAMADCETASLDNTGADMTYRVLDLSVWYASTGFTAADTILATAEDLAAGRYRIEACSADAMQEDLERIRKSDLDLEEVILRCLERDWFPGELERQLFWAYAHADPAILMYPGRHLGEFLTASRRFEIVRSIGAPMLCLPGQEVAQGIFESAASLVQEKGRKGRIGSIDAIFDDLGVSMSQTTVQALIRSALVEDDLDRDTLLHVILPAGPMSFVSGKQRTAFMRKYNALWDRLARQEARKPTAPGVAALRDKALDARMSILESLRELDFACVAPEELPGEQMLHLMEIEKLLDMILQYCENDRHGLEIPDTMTDMLDGIRSEAEATVQHVFEQLGLEED